MASPYTEKLSGSDHLLPKMYWKKKKNHTPGTQRVSQELPKIQQESTNLLLLAAVFPRCRSGNPTLSVLSSGFLEYPTRICQLNYTERLQDC